MGHALKELALAIFTTLAPMGTGAFICLSPLLWMRKDADEFRRLLWGLLGVWVVVALGFIGASTHLHYILHAPYTFMRIGHSPLTNEVAAGVGFMAIAGLWWLVEFLKNTKLIKKLTFEKFPVMLSRIWLALGVVAGFVFLYFIGIAYNINTVPSWNNAWAMTSLLLLGLVGGPVLASTVLSFCKVHKRAYQWVLGIVGSIGIIAFIGVNVGFYQFLKTGAFNSFGSALDLMPAHMQVLGVCFVCLGIVVLHWIILLTRKTVCRWGMLLNCILIFAGVLAARLFFYGMHLTFGLV